MDDPFFSLITLDDATDDSHLDFEEIDTRDAESTDRSRALVSGLPARPGTIRR